MNKNANHLIVRGAVNKIGNMLYDYGNSVWLASLGHLGQTVLGIYQLSDLLTSILFNPFGGVISDRISRRKILLITDFICGTLCLAISFITNKEWLISALIVANIIQAMAFAFSRPANKAYITEIVQKEDIITYNSHLELVLQVVSVSAPVLSFIVLNFVSLQMVLILDALSFFVAFFLVYIIPIQEENRRQTQLSVRGVFKDMKEGILYIWEQKYILFLLVIASLVNFFFAAFNYLLPFSDKLFHQKGAYASILVFGAAGAIIGALLASKIRATLNYLLFSLLLTGIGVLMMGIFSSLSFPIFMIYFGNLVCELFMSIFNIHFFTEVQTKVEGEYLGRVLSTIYTLAIVLMPLATGLMTLLPSVKIASFTFIGLGVVILSILAYMYQLVRTQK